MEILLQEGNVYRPRDPLSTDLHKIVRENYLQTFYDKEINGVVFPYHLKREFDHYLTCGVLAHGFARFHCGHCNRDKLVAYSCKGRTICPSCTGRRMADTAKHLVEEVIPEVGVRQWVLSMPFKQRFLLSSNNKLLSAILGIYHRAIAGFYTGKAKKLKLKSPQTGAISVVQRFGGSLNLNIHFHTLFMDGVYYENPYGKLTFREIIPSDEDVTALAKKVKKRIDRAFEKRGLIDSLLPEEVPMDSGNDEDPQLGLLRAESVQNRVDGHDRPKAIGKFWDPPFKEFAGKRCVYVDGYSLHAQVKILKNQRSALEKLCRYVMRGALAKERIGLNSEGNVLLQLKNPFSDGTTHLEFTPDQFIKRIIALIPPPRLNLIRYFGVFGARHRNRKEVTSKAKFKKKKKKIKTYRTPWAELLKRVFKIEVDYCDLCGTKLELIATITSQSICRKILNHLGLEFALVEPRGPRAPPHLYNEDSDIYEEDLFNQESNW